MFGITHFGTFLLSGILMNIAPGADTLYILGRSISQGKKAGIMSALGISTGSLVHTFLAAFGLSVIISQSETAFMFIKYAGAAYLVFLGIKNIFSKKDKGTFQLQHEKTTIQYRKIYFSGVLTNVLNPKVALFFLAFLPQFIDPSYAKNYISFLILGITFTITGTLWCLLLAVYSSKLSSHLAKNYHIKTLIDRIMGFVFISLGIRLAFSQK
jgi:RhtB (resistance to homoserine/threonine) family protein